MVAPITMEKLLAAGLTIDLATIIIELARQANKPVKKGDPGAPGPAITVLTFEFDDEAGYLNALAAHGQNPLVQIIRYAQVSGNGT